MNGDGCSANCLIEQGWHCDINANHTSICSVDGTVLMTLDRIYKYSGQNKVILYITLSIAIRLKAENVIINIPGLTNPNSISWTLAQTETDLSQVQVYLTYTESLAGKTVQISYSQTRRLLQSTSFNFSTEFTIDSYPPAVFYP